MKVICPVCDSSNYVLRQGQYFCSMCNTQSQELGMETVMDDETIPLEVQGRNNAMTVGKGRNGKGKKRSLCEEMRWGTAEGLSWVLRGWVDQLKNIEVDVEIAVIQLWTLYLRKLKMGFEKMGEEGMMGRENLKYREKWNMIGGPPGVLHNLTLAASKRRRFSVEDEGLGDGVEYGEETLQERRIRRKKRRYFFKSVSEAGSGSEMNSKSPSAHSSHGGSGISSGGVSEDEFSETGYITHPVLISRVMERFVNKKDWKQVQDSKVKDAACLPTVLHMKQMAALLTLAVIGLPASTLTIADMVTWFNSEELTWKSAHAFLPTSYSNITGENRFFSGRQVVLTTNMMSVLVFRLASFLHQSPEKHFNLISLPPVKKSKSPQTFRSVLSRLLSDLSLPTVLCVDITNSFKHLHLVNISASLQSYTPENTGEVWATNKFPLVSKRILALILFTLKYHCGLDDQYEVFLSHNIKKMSTLDEGPDINYFDILTWIRLSKLRLDHLMATNHCVREQYHSLAHAGTRGLVRPAIIHKLRLEDKSPSVGNNLNPEKRFSELTKLMSELSVKVKPKENNHLCLQPLLDESAALLSSGATKPGLKKLLEKLLVMTETNMSLCYEKQSCSLTSILHSNHGVGVYSEYRKKTVKKVKSVKNCIATPKTQKKKQFVEMVLSGRSRKSKFHVPQPKMRPDKLFLVTNKVYWFAHHYTVAQLLSNEVLDILPPNFTWILKYFSCYAHLPSLELLEELNEIEKLVLVLDPEFFGLPVKAKSKQGLPVKAKAKQNQVKTKHKLLPWKGGHVEVAD